MVGPPPGSSRTEPSISTLVRKSPTSPEAPTAGAPGVESEDVRAYPVQTPASQYQSYMLKVQTRSFGCTPWSRVVSLLTTTCW